MTQQKPGGIFAVTTYDVAPKRHVEETRRRNKNGGTLVVNFSH